MAVPKKITTLIDEAAQTDVSVKKETAQLKADEETLAEWWFSQGGKVLGNKFEGPKGGEATFSETETYTPIPVTALHEILQRQGKLGRFFDCIKVDLTALRDVLGADDIAELQGPSVATKVSVRLKLK